MIVPTADRTKATVMIKVRFLEKDSRVLPEMSAKIAFLSRPVKEEEQKPRTAIYQTSVVTRNGKTALFLVKGDRVFETPVTLGQPLGDMVEVLEGVKSGDLIVLHPSDRLKHGAKIKAEEK